MLPKMSVCLYVEKYKCLDFVGEKEANRIFHRFLRANDKIVN